MIPVGNFFIFQVAGTPGCLTGDIELMRGGGGAALMGPMVFLTGQLRYLRDYTIATQSRQITE